MSNNYKVEFSPLAKEKLAEIHTYMSEHFASPATARNFLFEVEKAVAYLKTDPYIYPSCQAEAMEDRRKCLVKNYLLIYNVIDEKKIVHISYIYHGSENYGNKLR